jgi:hypothetical protein
MARLSKEYIAEQRLKNLSNLVVQPNTQEVLSLVPEGREKVPLSIKGARSFLRSIANELVQAQGSSGEVIMITRYENMIRKMFISDAPRDRELLMRALQPGLMADKLDITTNGKDLQPQVLFYLPNNNRGGQIDSTMGPVIDAASQDSSEDEDPEVDEPEVDEPPTDMETDDDS